MILSFPSCRSSDRAMRHIGSRYSIACEAYWLAEGIACERPFEGLEPTIPQALVREPLEDAPLDLTIQAPGRRRKGLLVADMESTIIREEMLDELAALAGIPEEVAGITALAMAGEQIGRASCRESVCPEV